MKTYTKEGVTRLSEESQDCWIIVCGRVFCIDKQYLNDHPGGRDVLMENNGKDATEEWTSIKHSKRARLKMKDFLVGEIEGNTHEDWTSSEFVWEETKQWKKRKEATQQKKKFTNAAIAVLFIATAVMIIQSQIPLF